VCVMFHFFRNHTDYDYWSIVMHTFIQWIVIATSRIETPKTIVQFMHTLFKFFKNFLSMPTHYKYVCPSDHILKWHLAKQLLSSSMLHIFHTCQASYSQQATIVTPTLKDMFMNIHALFKCNYTSTSIQHRQKRNKVWLHTFLLHLSKQL
jgi:hypothetical protein